MSYRILGSKRVQLKPKRGLGFRGPNTVFAIIMQQMYSGEYMDMYDAFFLMERLPGLGAASLGAVTGAS